MKVFFNENKNNLLLYIIVTVIGVATYFLFLRFNSFIYGFNFVLSIFTPFFIGFAIAYLLNPTLILIEKRLFFFINEKNKKFKRMISVLLTYVITIFIITSLVILLAPQVKASVLTLFDNIPTYIYNLRELINNALILYNIDPTYVNQTITYESLIAYATKLFKASFDWLIYVPMYLTKGLTNTLVSIVISIYFLLDKERFIKQINTTIYALLKKETAKTVIDVSKMTNTTFSKFILGKIIDSAIIGLIAFPFMLIIYRPYALLISVIIGVTNVIPFFGPFIGAIPSAIIILMVAPDRLLWFLIFVLVLQQFDGNILGPKILGDSIGMPPIWVMLGIFAGSKLLGFLGMIVGVPITAVLYLLFKSYVEKKCNEKNILLENI